MEHSTAIVTEVTARDAEAAASNGVVAETTGKETAVRARRAIETAGIVDPIGTETTV